MNSVIKGVFATDSGMLAIWRPDSFSQIIDYDSWERELLEDSDIARHISAGAFVPINIQSDGAFACEVRVGGRDAGATLSDRERRYLTVSSQPYKFLSRGDLALSGIEHIEGKVGSRVGRLALPPGEFAVQVHLVAWDEESGMKDSQGKPAASALPDFVILLNPPAGNECYRKSVDTFEENA